MVCLKLLKEYAARLVNISQQTRKVPLLWKTTCLVPVPKSRSLKEINDLRPVALTFHIMKTMERILLFLKPATA